MGTIQIDGSTPKITIGNATAEDATILFDGNAQDFYIALDDSADDLLIGKGSTVGTTPAIAIDENLKVNIPVTTASTSASTGSLTTGGGAGIGADLYVGDDTYLITDSAVLGFGADKDTLLTHTDGTGLTLNSTNKLCFNDASQFVQGSSATVLSIGATDEIDLTATAVDLNGTLDVSGNSQFSGTITVGVDDTGLDVKFFGATASSYMLWDESADALNLVASTLGVVSAKDLGVGVHIRTADSGADVGGAADELVVEGSGNAGMSILSGNSHIGGIYFADDGDNDIGKVEYDHSDNSMRFTTNAGESMRITKGTYSRLSIGTTSVAANARVEIHSDNSGNIASDRDGTSSATHFAFLNDNGAVGFITTNGSATAYATSSDYRLKENQVAIDDGITRIKQLKPYRFNFKADADKTLDGFFAHEVSGIVPEAVSGEKDATETRLKIVKKANGKIIETDVEEADWTQGKLDEKYPSDSTWIASEDTIVSQGIDQAKLVPILVASIKELITRVETLEG